MQPACAGPRSPTWFCFNPHPARRPDATAGLPPARLSPTCFNPHPARRPDATRDGSDTLVSINGVSILIRPSGRMQHGFVCLQQFADCLGFNPHPARRPDATLALAGLNPTIFDVSILIRPEGRMQPRAISTRRCSSLFQSSSGQKAGCNPISEARWFGIQQVSILIRPEGRMQRPPRHPLRKSFTGFNPHPARRPDATAWPLLQAPTSRGFNPHPARRPDATRRWTTGAASSWKFQSSSGQKAGCNKSPARSTPKALAFQSSSGQKAGCNPVQNS